jgi:hypothetical protein
VIPVSDTCAVDVTVLTFLAVSLIYVGEYNICYGRELFATFVSCVLK